MPAKKKAAAKPSAKKKAAKTTDTKEKKKELSVLDVFKSVERSREVRHIDLHQATQADFLSTGILSLDLILGGGYFGGRILQFYGPAGAGKSSVAFMTAGRLHKQKILTGFWDFEGTLDRAYCERLGMDYDNVRYYRPAHGPEGYKQMLDIVVQLKDMNGGPPQAAIIIDSVAAMSPAEMIEDVDNKVNNMPARQAAMHSKWMNALKPYIAKKNIALIAINQIRAGMSMYKPESRPGGNAWEFATDNMIKVKKGESVQVGGQVYQPILFKTLKNKNFIPLQECTVMLALGIGIDPASDVMEFLRLTGVKKKVGSGKDARVVIKGLDKYAPHGEKLDGTWPKAEFGQVEQLVRDQCLGDEPAYYTAVQNFLRSGDAKVAYMEEAKKVNPDDKKKKRDTSDEVGAEKIVVDDEDEAPPAEAVEGEGSEAAEADVPEASSATSSEEDGQKAVAKLKKNRKKVA
jgi:recombination protein RecA